jgi:hypothetical protein
MNRMGMIRAAPWTSGGKGAMARLEERPVEVRRRSERRHAQSPLNTGFCFAANAS